jgi:hypothetical protein
VVLQAVADELANASAVLSERLRNVRLTADRAAAFAAALDGLVEGLEDAGEAGERYGILVTVWKPQPAGTP